MRRGLFFLFFSFALMGWARAEEYPQAMAALGDSMSEAVLADFAFETGVSGSELMRMLQLASIEDPKARILAFRDHYAARGKAWATGLDENSLVYSHAQRLREINPSLEVRNFAVAGSEAFELADQVDALLEYEKSNPIVFDYFTLLIGANDLKANTLEGVTSPMEFVAHVEAQLRRIIETRDSAWILLSGLPDIFKTFEETKHLVVEKVFGRPVTCDMVRRSIYGNSVIFEDKNENLMRGIRQLYADYHAGLRMLAYRLSQEYPATHIRFIDPFSSSQKPEKQISVDCFHPSEWGQAEIAELTWQAGFWPDLQMGLPDLGFLKTSF